MTQRKTKMMMSDVQGTCAIGCPAPLVTLDENMKSYWVVDVK